MGPATTTRSPRWGGGRLPLVSSVPLPLEVGAPFARKLSNRLVEEPPLRHPTATTHPPGHRPPAALQKFGRASAKGSVTTSGPLARKLALCPTVLT